MRGVIKALRNHCHQQVVVTSSTASSASLLDGVTLHKFFGFPAAVCATPEGKILCHANKKVQLCDVLIVDEISMVRIDVWEAAFKSIIVANAKRKQQGKKPIKIIVCGDFAQLPPIIPLAEKSVLDRIFGFDVRGGYAFMAPAWEKCNFRTFILKEVVRQDTKDFIAKLADVRYGKPIDIMWLLDNTSNMEIQGATYIMPYNKQVDAYNLRKLNELEGKLYAFEPELIDHTPEADIALLGLERVLYLKVGCQIRFTCNCYHGAPWLLVDGLPENLRTDRFFDWSRDFKNSSTGIVREITWDDSLNGGLGDWKICIEVTDKTTYSGGDHYVTITRRDFKTYDYKVDSRGKLKRYVTGTVRQLPIMPAYAISVHRSQGMTLEAANIDLRGSFCHGQVYVALSRCSDISKCHIFDVQVKASDIICDPDVTDFYNSINTI